MPVGGIVVQRWRRGRLLPLEPCVLARQIVPTILSERQQIHHLVPKSLPGYLVEEEGFLVEEEEGFLVEEEGFLVEEEEGFLVEEEGFLVESGLGYW